MQRLIIRSRTGYLAIVLLVAMAAFVLRLFQLQILQYGKYTEMARASQQRQFVIPAERGKIYMMDGKTPVPVVLNQATYTVIADPQAVDDKERNQIITSMREIAGGEMTDGVAERLANKKSRYEVLAKNITRTQAEKLKEKNFAGVLYQQGSVRSYPEGGLGAHVLGFVNVAGEGQYGVEGSLNSRLKGQDGLLQSVTDVRNVPLTVGKNNMRIEAKSGDNLALTVDRNIQSQAELALKKGIEAVNATEGSAVIMNPKNGQILALANYPTYNPAEFNKQKNAAVFMNSASMVPFEPGSIIKSFSFATAIDKGAVTPSSTYNNTDCIKVADRTMCNALRGLSGTTTIQGAFNNSLNVGTITAIRRLGNGSQINLAARQVLYEYYHDKFGFGQKTGIELGEASGYIYPPDSVEGNEVRYSAMTYGQSMNLTMVQVAAGFSSLVNGGQYYKPTVLRGVIDVYGNLKSSESKSIRQTVSGDTSSQMRTMLATARQSSFLSKSDKPGYEIGGKTGTSEAVVNGSYTQKETIATYIGYGGGKNGVEYVIMVRVAAPGKGINLQGNLHAGPIFTDISNWMIDHMKIAPKE
jgi:peptidoglycan glycosyltransferase